MEWIKNIKLEIINQQETPFVLINLDQVKENLSFIKGLIKENNVDWKVYYAIKASYFYPVLKSLKEAGINGIEVISNLEKNIANKAGFSNNQIVYNGLFRKKQEILEVLKEGGIVNIDSVQELESLIGEQDLSLGLRFYPEFEGQGNFVKKESKLGLDKFSFEKCINLCKKEKIRVRGLSFHIYSNLTELSDLKKSIEGCLNLIDKIEKELGYSLEYLDIGGGFDAPSLLSENFSEQFKEISSLIKQRKPKIKVISEFGRFLVNDAVVIISSVKGIKENALKKWVVIDIGTNYLIPAPGKNFKVFPLIKRKPDNKQKSHIVYAICSPAGIIQEDNSFGPYKIGEKIAVCNSGAYTSVMKEQFIFEDPKHLFLKEGMVVETIDKFKLNDVLRYHGWKIKCN